MERPYTICHILSSLNGKISGPFMGTEAAAPVIGEYARIRTELGGNAWLYGAATTKEFTGNRKPELPDETSPVPDGDYAADDQAQLYYVSVDTAGEIGWESGTFAMPGRPKAHVIEILTENTPLAYRAYLRARKVSYILAGKDVLDCRLAEEKLYRLFGIRRLLICGGGIVNGSFLKAQVVDELSLLLAPVCDTEPGPSVFERMEGMESGLPAEFDLGDMRQVKGGGVWLTYLFKHKERENEEEM